MIDLTKFCGPLGYRRNLSVPFSRGEYTWATDGKILVRVPRREDVPELPNAPNVARVWPAETTSLFRAKQIELPPAEYVDCEDCEGRCTIHDCPYCNCICQTCDGDGRLEVLTAVSIGARAINTKYARLMINLPALKIDHEPTDDAVVAQFSFDGGEGIVSLLSTKHVLPVIASLSESSAQ